MGQNLSVSCSCWWLHLCDPKPLPPARGHEPGVHSEGPELGAGATGWAWTGRSWESWWACVSANALGSLVTVFCLFGVF